MSDFSGLEQSFALSSAAPLGLPDEDAFAAPISNEVHPHEVSFRQLRGAHEISRILPLRHEIALPAAALADAGFAAREKKETKSVSSVRSCASARPSAPSASFR
jgi:hypothetical protein